jgi:hypothetical protein
MEVAQYSLKNGGALKKVPIYTEKDLCCILDSALFIHFLTVGGSRL